jgi:hypothetical protein
MADARGRAPLRMDLRKGKEASRVPRVPRVSWPVMIVVALVLLAVRLGLGRVSPGAGVAFEVALRWLVAVGGVFGFWLAWGYRRDAEIPLRWLLFVGAVAVWFLWRAAYETYGALA